MKAMQNYKLVENKLEQFIKKYYYNELIKGGILFLAAGLLYLLITLALEYFLWLSPVYRQILFWSFIIVEFALFSKFIIYPMTKLIKLTKGIDYNYASEIIGRSFPEVNDRLTNILQLKSMQQDSDLVVESIEQKAVQIKPVPFQDAIDFKSNMPYLKYAFFPIIIMILIWVTGKYDFFTTSYERVVNYKQAYEPPAPFKIKILNDSLVTTNQQAFSIQAKTIGDLAPQQMKIHLESGNSFLMNRTKKGSFNFDFDKMKEPTHFYLSANNVNSKNYKIDVLSVPMIDNIQLRADIPSYTNMENKQVDGTGNIKVPEGTNLTWLVNTTATDQLSLELADSIYDFKSQKEKFTISKRLFQSTRYVISSSNKYLKNYDRLDYSVQVIQDESPAIEVKVKKDSLDSDKKYFSGTTSDDYAISSINLFYYPLDQRDEIRKVKLKEPNSSFAQFYYTFPNDELDLTEGHSYEYYFQTTDNDQVNGFKSTRTSTFSFRKRTQEEEKEKQLEQQDETIENMEESLKKMKKKKSSLDELKKMQLEKEELNYSDKKKIKDFIKRQQQQQSLMERFNKSMQENLNNFNEEENSQEKKDLQKRLKSNEENLEKNKDLLKQLDKYNKKLNNEDLQKDLEEFEKERSKQERNLEEILELTKRYYVEEKTRKLAKDLEKLAKKQKELSDKQEKNESQAQDLLNKDFEKVSQELDSLQKENKQLKEPYPIPESKEEQESIKNDQKKAKNDLEKSEKSSSDKKQKQKQQDANDSQGKAAKKMQKMSQQMNSMMMMAGQQQAQEDAEMLRRILQNLLVYSKEQEALMNRFKSIDDQSPNFGKYLKRQATLKENFKHVDDSLFSLALRNPMIGQRITDKITEVDYNIDKSLEKLADNQIRVGTSKQQFAMKYANDLANMLDNSLDQMQQMLGKGSGKGASGKGKGKGQGKGRGFQLSDIIKSQEELSKEMKKGIKKGNQPSNPGKDGKQGEKGKKGGKKGGKNGRGQQNGNSDKKGNQEKQSGQLYKIYKKQQELKNQLQDLIRKKGLRDDSGKLEKSMEQLEKELLMKGFSNSSLKRMEQIKHELLKLKNAAQKQNKSNKRKSTTNTQQFSNPSTDNIDEAKDYFKRVEILNRQNLPLQIKYQSLIKRYFNYE